jgi:hypothetical protein
MSNRRPYVRPVDGWWWRIDPFFVRYMIREANSVIVVAYAVVLLWGAVRLAQAGGVQRMAGIRQLSTTADRAGTALAYVELVFHHAQDHAADTASGRRLSPAVVTGTGVAVSAIPCLALFLVALAKP